MDKGSAAATGGGTGMTLDAVATLRVPDSATGDGAGEPDLTSKALASGTRFILALFVDLAGKPCAKLVPVEAVDQLQTEGVGFAGYAAGALGQRPSDPDVM